MSKKQQVHSFAENDSDPTFEVRQLKSGLGWYVQVFWSYGQLEHVENFKSADEAQSWINNKSKGWLQSRIAALRG
jgi:hypothetical protein